MSTTEEETSVNDLPVAVLRVDKKVDAMAVDMKDGVRDDARAAVGTARVNTTETEELRRLLSSEVVR